MAISVCIDFGNLYAMEEISEDLRIGSFLAELENGSSVLLKVKINSEPHPMMPSVYNLAFGPPREKGRIDDTARLAYKDYSKVFPTILFHGFNYLIRNEEHSLGLDGSTNSRARLYYTFMQRNYDYLTRYFNFYGLKYYVRITRFGKNQYDNPFNFSDIQFDYESIEKGSERSSLEMYNYFIFNIK